MDTQIKSVPYNPENVMKCQCTSCPVQAQSACATDKKMAMAPMIEKMSQMMGGDMSPMSGTQASDTSGTMLPSAEDMPGMYCANGTAACTDLDFSKACVCPTCAVWSDNALSNTQYCSKGSAAQVG